MLEQRKATYSLRVKRVLLEIGLTIKVRGPPRPRSEAGVVEQVSAEAGRYSTATAVVGVGRRQWAETMTWTAARPDGWRPGLILLQVPGSWLRVDRRVDVLACLVSWVLMVVLV